MAQGPISGHELLILEVNR